MVDAKMNVGFVFGGHNKPEPFIEADLACHSLRRFCQGVAVPGYQFAWVLFQVLAAGLNISAELGEVKLWPFGDKHDANTSIGPQYWVNRPAVQALRKLFARDEQRRGLV